MVRLSTTSSRNRSHSYSSVSTSNSNNNSPYYHHRPQTAVRTAPLCVGCALLLVVPFFVFNIVNTTKSLNRSDDAARMANEQLLVMEHEQPPWWHPQPNGSSNDNKEPKQQRSMKSSSSSIYQGQSWIQSSSSSGGNVVVAAETVLAKCEIHQRQGQDYLVLEEQDTIQIVVLDTHDRLWVLRHDADNNNNQQPFLFAMPIPSTVYGPVTGYCANANEAPWYAAQRIVAHVLGILPETTAITTTTEHNSHDRILDEYGIKEGQFPDSNNQLLGEGQHEWIYLGRHRTMANRGGGFVYSYLIRNVSGSPRDTTTGSTAVVALSKDQVQQALRDDQFADVRAIATISLALLQGQPQ